MYLLYGSPLFYVISDWFSNVLPQKILHFLQPVKSESIWLGNLQGFFVKITPTEKILIRSYTQMVISQKVGEVWIDFGIKWKLKVCSLPTCSLFCGSASHVLSENYQLHLKKFQFQFDSVLLQRHISWPGGQIASGLYNFETLKTLKDI